MMLLGNLCEGYMAITITLQELIQDMPPGLSIKVNPSLISGGFLKLDRSDGWRWAKICTLAFNYRIRLNIGCINRPLHIKSNNPPSGKLNSIGKIEVNWIQASTPEIPMVGEGSS